MSHVSDEIYLLNKRLRLRQPADGFRSCLDTVLLAAACPAHAGDHILDLGAGVGGAGLCVALRVQDVKITGVELQADHVELAAQNAALNGMAERADFVHSDIRDFESARFDHVIANPPYMEAGTHLASPHDKKAAAHNHGETTLEDWIDAAHLNLKSGGSFTIIHRADHTDKIILGLGKRFGAIEIIPLWPKTGVNAKRVIIRAIKDRRSPAVLHAGLTLHEAGGEYTQVAENILRSAAALP
jgi:tRNA1(Val) A37 N6-methylase TrmN6